MLELHREQVRILSLVTPLAQRDYREYMNLEATKNHFIQALQAGDAGSAIQALSNMETMYHQALVDSENINKYLSDYDKLVKNMEALDAEEEVVLDKMRKASKREIKVVKKKAKVASKSGGALPTKP